MKHSQSIVNKSVDLSKHNLQRLKCHMHSEIVKCFQLRSIKDLDFEKIYFVARCSKCINQFQNQSGMVLFSVENFQAFKDMSTEIGKTMQEPVQYIKLKKKQISDYLRSKFVRRIRYINLYTLLNDFNKDFLERQEIFDENIDNQIEKQKFKEFKNWIKDPQRFQQQFNLTLNKSNLKSILNMKYMLLNSVKKIQKFVQHAGLKLKQKNIEIKLLKISSIQAQLAIQKIIQHNLKQVYQAQKLAFALMLSTIRNQTHIQRINQYLTKFIYLYESLRFESNIVKFNVGIQTFKDFCLNIKQTTVTLKNSNLDESQEYDQMDYKSEFAFINDGEYILKNEYRANIFCEDKMDLQRDENTMIGRQHQIPKCRRNSFMETGKMIKINKYLSANYKLYLKLRLNAVEFDLVSIRILSASSLNTYVNGFNQCLMSFDLQIIPDEGDNCRIFGFCKQGQGNPVRQTVTKEQTDKKLMVLQDDIISLYLNETETKLVCWNETRNNLLCQKMMTKPNLTIVNDLKFQLKVYLGLVLFTTVSEIEICDFLALK